MDHKQMSTIYTLIKKGDLTAVRSIIEEGGIDIDTIDKDGATLLHNAAYAGWKEIVEYLCDNGVKVNIGSNNGYTPLMVSSREGYLDIVKKLLQSGANVNQSDDEGFTALIFASAYSMNSEVVWELIQAGANLDDTTKTGGSSLLWATWYNMTENVRILLENGANKDISFNGKKPIDIAKEKKFYKIENLLR